MVARPREPGLRVAAPVSPARLREQSPVVRVGAGCQTERAVGGMGRRRGTAVRAVALALSAMVVSGCTMWPMFRSGAARTGENRLERTISAANVAGLQQAWTDTTNAPITSPVVSRGVSYVTSGGTLFAFDAFG